jgi:hypothetical protein
VALLNGVKFREERYNVNGNGENVDVNISFVLDDGTPVRENKKADKKYGIMLDKNPVMTDYAQIKMRIPEKSEVKLAVYDNTGNLMFYSECETRNSELATKAWNLTNADGRKVANGSYLVVVEAKGQSGKVYRYSAKLGVNRR